jgi:tetratricopeptide (TPR) repeat protein
MTRTYRIAIGAFILLTVGCASAAAEPISASNLPAGPTTPDMPEIRDAKARFDKLDFEGASKLLKEAAKKDPDQRPANLVLAEWLARTGRNPRPALEQAVIDLPDDPEAYLTMGIIALGEQRVTEADMLFQKAGDLLSRFTGSAKRKAAMLPMLDGGLARACQARADYAGQQKWLEALLKLDPKNTNAMETLGRCLFTQKKPEAALAKLKDAKNLDPSVLPEVLLADWCQSIGDRENASKWMTAALAAAPKDAKTHIAAAKLAFNNEQYDEMLKQGTKALEIQPGNIDGVVVVGLVSLFRKDYKTAETYFDWANRKRNSKVFSISNDLALALAEQKDEAKRDRALQIASENARIYPNNANAAATLGWVYYKKAMLADAEKYLRKAIQLGKYDTDTFYQFARVRHERGYDAEAKQALELAVNIPGPSAYRQDAKALLETLKK